jgi:hypothetical protein
MLLRCTDVGLRRRSGHHLVTWPRQPSRRPASVLRFFVTFTRRRALTNICASTAGCHMWPRARRVRTSSPGRSNALTARSPPMSGPGFSVCLIGVLRGWDGQRPGRSISRHSRRACLNHFFDFVWWAVEISVRTSCASLASLSSRRRAMFSRTAVAFLLLRPEWLSVHRRGVLCSFWRFVEAIRLRAYSSVLRYCCPNQKLLTNGTISPK